MQIEGKLRRASPFRLNNVGSCVRFHSVACTNVGLTHVVVEKVERKCVWMYFFFVFCVCVRFVLSPEKKNGYTGQNSSPSSISPQSHWPSRNGKVAVFTIVNWAPDCGLSTFSQISTILFP